MDSVTEKQKSGPGRHSIVGQAPARQSDPHPYKIQHLPTMSYSYGHHLGVVFMAGDPAIHKEEAHSAGAARPAMGLRTGEGFRLAGKKFYIIKSTHWHIGI